MTERVSRNKPRQVSFVCTILDLVIYIHITCVPITVDRRVRYARRSCRQDITRHQCARLWLIQPNVLLSDTTTVRHPNVHKYWDLSIHCCLHTFYQHVFPPIHCSSSLVPLIRSQSFHRTSTPHDQSINHTRVP